MPQSQIQGSKRDGYKLWFDLSILILAHVLLFPILILLWAIIPSLIWLGDRGPIFYSQTRAGKDGRAITILKFRTMVSDADHSGPMWTTEGDPRVTRVGRILRRTALDELPEVLSIWKGDMSFVGPRALDVKEQREFESRIPGFRDRLHVRPGLTGLAQIYDQTDDAYDKLRYDLEYVDRMNLWLDSKLLVLSVWKTVTAQWDHRAGKPAFPDQDLSMPDTVEKENESLGQGKIETPRHS